MTKKRPLVTIGLPVHNARRTIAAAVQSVICQTYDNWELIIIDDGSTDGSLDEIQSVDDPRVRVIRDVNNRGLAFRLNQITAEARGEYVARFDADDMLHPDRIRRQIEYFERHPSTDVLGTGMYMVDNNDQVFGVRFSRHLATSVREVLRKGLLLHATIMARRAWFLQYPYDDKLRRAQDRDLWCRTVGASTFDAIQEPLYFCREAGAVSAQAYLRKYLGNRNVRLLLLQRYGREHMTVRERLWETGLALAKGEIYRVLTMCGLHELLIARRGSELSHEERIVAQDMFDKIKKGALVNR